MIGFDFLESTDINQMDGRVYYNYCEMKAEPHLDLSEPYVDLQFMLGNLSIFDLTLESTTSAFWAQAPMAMTMNCWPERGR
jgi:hypothetical protein